MIAPGLPKTEYRVATAQCYEKLECFDDAERILLPMYKGKKTGYLSNLSKLYEMSNQNEKLIDLLLDAADDKRFTWGLKPETASALAAEYPNEWEDLRLKASEQARQWSESGSTKDKKDAEKLRRFYNLP